MLVNNKLQARLDETSNLGYKWDKAEVKYMIDTTNSPGTYYVSGLKTGLGVWNADFVWLLM